MVKTKKIKIDKNLGYYLPLFNELGIKSSITPYFGGDLKLDHHHYLLEPTSELDLFKNSYARNVIFTVNHQQYFLNGSSLHQQDDLLEYESGRLYQRVTRTNALFSLETTTYVPVSDPLEVHEIHIKNISNQDLEMDIITAIPIYGRSADNLRDHRHVTSLLNRIQRDDSGVLMTPTLSFDERGHIKNTYTYAVYAHIDDVKVQRMITNIDDFLDGGTFNFPKGIYNTQSPDREGYEAIAGIGFEKISLKPNETKTLYITLGIHENTPLEIRKTHKKFHQKIHFEHELNHVIKHFDALKHKLNFNLISEETSELLDWVGVQPVLRRYFGNSYLPHHDYGRGGRGWRDLWQDLLSLIMHNETEIKDLLINNFAGIRIDGSNATIIGSKPGEFLADRNKIVRVWSDHGAWPLLTTEMYIHETGDISFLKLEQSYFDDKFTHYTYQTKDSFDKDYILKVNESIYKGTVLEHLLIQNIVAHFNTGEFGFIKLEDADWNDGLDMAKEHGETVAFTHFYANNLRRLAVLIEKLDDDIKIYSALKELIFGEISLETFFEKAKSFDGNQVRVQKDKLIKRLEELSIERINHIEKHAWIDDTHLQSYVTNHKVFLDDSNSSNLTGQAMALLSQTIDHQKVHRLVQKNKELLFDKKRGGYHLNTDYKKLLTEMGRAYGFSYHHKENGAVFSHMAIMYIYGLYQYNFVKEGSEGYHALIARSLEKESHILRGIPEYFNDLGIGKYLYLTGSASWLLKLLREQVFGIRLQYGKLTLNPKLTLNEFINKEASIETIIQGNSIKITYKNLKNLDYGQYKIKEIHQDGKIIDENNLKPSGRIEVYLDEI